MKKLVFLLFALAFFCPVAKTQVPQGFNYQAVAYDAGGSPIKNTSLDVKIAILSDTVTPVIVREELFSAVKTNSFGLFSLVIGTGAYSAGPVVNFSDIKWTEKPLFIRSRIYYLGTWKHMGSAKLWSVPYSMVAREVGALNKLKVAGKETSLDSALFEVKNRDGQTIFAVYNEGVRIYVDDGASKGTKGGFAIGGFGSAKAGSQPLFIVNSDSIRGYIDTNPLIKATKGGFAIGGFGTAKAAPEEYLRVTRDSSRIYTSDAAKGTKGGFAIGGFGAAKGTPNNYLNLTPQNYFIGHLAGYGNTTGLYNSYMGYYSGYSNKAGNYNTLMGYESGMTLNSSYNTLIGYQAGRSGTTADGNVFIGYKSGYATTWGYRNVFVGYNSGQNNVSGYENTFLGGHAGYAFTQGNANLMIGTYAGNWFNGGNNNIFIGNRSGYGVKFSPTLADNNIFIGKSAGAGITTGSENVIIGSSSGLVNSSGSYNTFLGFETGYSNTTGGTNSFIGFQSGYTNSTGYNNVFLGKSSGYSNTTGYDNVIIGTEAGFLNLEGFGNTFLGHQAGYSNTTGFYNIFIGEYAGQSNTTASRNVFLGQYAGRFNSTGQANTFIGQQTGEYNTTGSFNFFAGRSAGNFNTTGQGNTFLGINAGNSNKTGNYNVNVGGESGKLNDNGSNNTHLGWGAGYATVTGDDNIMIGYYSGISLGSGSGNVFIGKYAGGGLTTASNKLFIENSNEDHTTALIYGDFAVNYLRFNATTDITGNVAIGKTTPATKLDIASGNWDVLNSEGDFRIGDGSYRLKIGVANSGGGAGDVRINSHGGTNRLVLGGGGKDIMFINNTFVGPWTDNFSSFGAPANRWTALYAVNGTIQTSDARLKRNIADLSYGLKDILSLKPVSFTWHDDATGTEHLGLIAQDVRKVIGEVVDEGDDAAHTLGINYSGLVPVLIKGMQEQQKLIDAEKAENARLSSEVDELRRRLEKLEKLLK